MTLSPLARDLRAKGARALASARELQERDPDGSVNRSYYAMFDIARAALLSAGVREDELPRTHSGVISAFSKHAVQSGRVDQKLSGALGRTESLRLMADYTGTALDAKTAADTVARAEAFVSAVEKAFSLDSVITNDLKDRNSGQENKISEPSVAMEQSESHYGPVKPVSLEEMRRQARENWLQHRRQHVGVAKELGQSVASDRSAKDDQGHALDDGLDD